jgi:hypothetical protein
MVPPPVAVAVTVCEKVIVEEGTRHLSFISVFKRLRARRFPARSQPFHVFAAFLDGQGDATIRLEIGHLDTGTKIYVQERRVHFPDRLTEVGVLYRVPPCEFPAPGIYQVTLFLDNEWMAHRYLHVHLSESKS